MFLTMDVVERVSTIITDEKNRKVQGFKTRIEKQIVNLTNLSVVKKTTVDESYPNTQHTIYPTDTAEIKDRELTLLTFMNGNVSSQMLVCISFEDMDKLLTKNRKQ